MERTKKNKESLKIDRPSLDEYFMKIAKVVASRSTCLRHQIGAVAIRDKTILTTGYNGAPSRLRDCLEKGICLRNELGIPSGERTEVCVAVHAEENVIIQAGLHEVSLEGATLYCTHSPCRRCAKMLINSKIKKLVFKHSYDDSIFEELFREARIDWKKIEILPKDLPEDLEWLKVWLEEDCNCPTNSKNFKGKRRNCWKCKRNLGLRLEINI